MTKYKWENIYVIPVRATTEIVTSQTRRPIHWSALQNDGNDTCLPEAQLAPSNPSGQSRKYGACLTNRQDPECPSAVRNRELHHHADRCESGFQTPGCNCVACGPAILCRSVYLLLPPSATRCHPHPGRPLRSRTERHRCARPARPRRVKCRKRASPADCDRSARRVYG